MPCEEQLHHWGKLLHVSNHLNIHAPTVGECAQRLQHNLLYRPHLSWSIGGSHRVCQFVILDIQIAQGAHRPAPLAMQYGCPMHQGTATSASGIANGPHHSRVFPLKQHVGHFFLQLCCHQNLLGG